MIFIQLDRDPYQRKVQILIFLTLVACCVHWFTVRHEKEVWINVPPAPSLLSARISSLSDDSFAYRTIGFMIQNIGDFGGRTTSLHEYNTKNLADWFMLEHSLDPKSNYIPYLAANYFGGVQEEYATKEKMDPIIDYLEVAGSSPEPGKWRWLAQAVNLARFRVHDYDRALVLARKLEAMANKDTTIPNWARALPGFVINQKGDKEGAKMIMLGILSSVAKGEIKIHPNEVNHMRDTICNRLMTLQEVKDSGDLCKNIP